MRCHDACEELQAHADMSPLTPEIAKRTIAAMIQHFFTEILPVPPNPTSSKYEKEIAPWILRQERTRRPFWTVKDVFSERCTVLPQTTQPRCSPPRSFYAGCTHCHERDVVGSCRCGM